MSAKLEIGAKVKYTKKFLRSIAAAATDPIWFREGAVTAFDDKGWPFVAWSDLPRGDPPCRVHPQNVATGIYANID